MFSSSTTSNFSYYFRPFFEAFSGSCFYDVVLLFLRRWNETDTESERYSKLMGFIGNVSALTYHTLASMEQFVKDPDFQNVDLLDLAQKVMVITSSFFLKINHIFT